jgi:hypothetical protein
VICIGSCVCVIVAAVIDACSCLKHQSTLSSCVTCCFSRCSRVSLSLSLSLIRSFVRFVVPSTDSIVNICCCATAAALLLACSFLEDIMGRNKIKIERLTNERNRQATFTKRKNGLIKKAMELSILCDCEIALMIFGINNKLYQYSSGEMNTTLQRYLDHNDSVLPLTNADVC